MPISEAEKVQISRNAADVYERFFVPALFQQFAGPVADEVGLQRAERALDVACGTGVLARELLQCVGAGGSVVGLDANESMLAVARRECPGIQWCQGASESIPFPSDSFDGVACQFGLMFFNDRRQSILEMARVLRPQRKLVVAVWGELHTSPGYAAMAQLLQRLFGRQAADALRLPFELGDLPTLTSLFADNQLRDLRVLTQTGAARFPSIQAWVTTEVKGWVLADMLDEAQFRRLQAEAEECLESFAAADGRVEFPVTIHIATAVKERRR